MPATHAAAQLCHASAHERGEHTGEVQELLGHKHVETTMIYTHVMRDMTKGPKSPLDLLEGSAGDG